MSQLEVVIFGFLAWAGKEAYQTFIGHRAKSSEKLDKALSEISILKVKLDEAARQNEYLRSRLDILVTEERKYRR